MTPGAPPPKADWLADLRAAARLAFVPVGVAITLGLLLVPRRAMPDSVPLPIPDARELARSDAVDRALAAEARARPLPGPVRALGSAVRGFHHVEATADPRVLGPARAAVDAALVKALPLGDGPLLRLRAAQLEEFLAAVRQFEGSGVEPGELTDLAGGFVRAMTDEGLCRGHALLAGEPALRALFKQMWDKFLGLDGREAFEPSLDERRALYAVYLEHPSPAPAARSALEAARHGAHDPSTCEAVDDAETAAIEARRIERIARLAAFDPAYPADYARGVANLRRRKFGLAADALRAWLRGHPDGPLALRAQTYLREAVLGEAQE